MDLHYAGMRAAATATLHEGCCEDNPLPTLLSGLGASLSGGFSSGGVRWRFLVPMACMCMAAGMGLGVAGVAQGAQLGFVVAQDEARRGDLAGQLAA